jgi:hypothetical protein
MLLSFKAVPIIKRSGVSAIPSRHLSARKNSNFEVCAILDSGSCASKAEGCGPTTHCRSAIGVNAESRLHCDSKFSERLRRTSACGSEIGEIMLSKMPAAAPEQCLPFGRSGSQVSLEVRGATSTNRLFLEDHTALTLAKVESEK